MLNRSWVCVFIQTHETTLGAGSASDRPAAQGASYPVIYFVHHNSETSRCCQLDQQRLNIHHCHMRSWFRRWTVGGASSPGLILSSRRSLPIIVLYISVYSKDSKYSWINTWRMNDVCMSLMFLGPQTESRLGLTLVQVRVWDGRIMSTVLTKYWQYCSQL